MFLNIGDYVTVTREMSIGDYTLYPNKRYLLKGKMTVLGIDFCVISDDDNTNYAVPERFLTLYFSNKHKDDSDILDFLNGLRTKAKKEEKQDIFSIPISRVTQNLSQEEQSIFAKLYEKAKGESAEEKARHKKTLLMNLELHADYKGEGEKYTLAIVERAGHKEVHVISDLKPAIVGAFYFSSKELARKVRDQFKDQILKYLV